MTVLGVAEHRQGELREVTYEVIEAGTELADALDTKFGIAVIGGDVDRFADQLHLSGVDDIYTVPAGEEFGHITSIRALEQLLDLADPNIVLMPHTVNGLAYAPAAATRFELPLVTDVVDWTANVDELTVTRERYGGKIAATYDVPVDRAAVTIRPAEWLATDREAGSANVTSVSIETGEEGVRRGGFEELTGGDVDITQADVLVSVGRGIEEEENLPLVDALAEVLDATVSSSRPIVDNGWLPRDRQVGQSGKTVAPDIYLAIGISGAVQHVSGMKGADTIIAINTDPDAPIFDIADYGIVGDLFDVVPELIAEFGGEHPL